MSEDVLLFAQATEISAVDRPDKIMRYDLSAESDSSVSLSSSFAIYVFTYFSTHNNFWYPYDNER